MPFARRLPLQSVLFESNPGLSARFLLCFERTRYDNTAPYPAETQAGAWSFANCKFIRAGR
jgi:hypothetical protein